MLAKTFYMWQPVARLSPYSTRLLQTATFKIPARRQSSEERWLSLSRRTGPRAQSMRLPILNIWNETNKLDTIENFNILWHKKWLTLVTWLPLKVIHLSSDSGRKLSRYRRSHGGCVVRWRSSAVSWVDFHLKIDKESDLQPSTPSGHLTTTEERLKHQRWHSTSWF